MTDEIKVDSTGLGYTVDAERKRIRVHYPVKGEFGAGIEIGDIPKSYFTDPPNEITRERAAIWKGLAPSLAEGDDDIAWADLVRGVFYP